MYDFDILKLLKSLDVEQFEKEAELVAEFLLGRIEPKERVDMEKLTPESSILFRVQYEVLKKKVRPYLSYLCAFSICWPYLGADRSQREMRIPGRNGRAHGAVHSRLDDILPDTAEVLE